VLGKNSLESVVGRTLGICVGGNGKALGNVVGCILGLASGVTLGSLLGIGICVGENDKAVGNVVG
jgi:hypothetical protein